MSTELAFAASPPGVRLAQLPPLSLYVHIPWCVRKCPYCDFNSHQARGDVPERAYVDALVSDLEQALPAVWGRRVGSVFFGGGTPSLATPDAIARIVDRLRTRLVVEPGAEVTVECNPESVSRERLAAYREAGVSRISLGVQSLDDRILPTLDRRHSGRDARLAFDAARAAGFDNVSVDLIYGLPELDLTSWEATLRGVLAWEPEHLSAYALALDEGSLWHAMGVTGLPSEDTVAEQYWRLVAMAREAGYEHYEVSNYARPGRRSEHNQIYWRAEEYLGLGPGAAGFLGSVRYVNVKPLERYCALVEDGRSPVGSHETLTARQRLAERLVLGLRTREGVPREWIDERLSLESERLAAQLEAWSEKALLIEERGRVKLTEAGFLLSDALFVELL